MKEHSCFPRYKCWAAYDKLPSENENSAFKSRFSLLKAFLIFNIHCSNISTENTDSQYVKLEANRVPGQNNITPEFIIALLQACNICKITHEIAAGEKDTVIWQDRYFPFGSLQVLTGCAFAGYSDRNYGVLSESRPRFHGPITIPLVRFIRSYICTQQIYTDKGKHRVHRSNKIIVSIFYACK